MNDKENAGVERSTSSVDAVKARQTSYGFSKPVILGEASNSVKSRASVMALGPIDKLQHFFANGAGTDDGESSELRSEYESLTGSQRKDSFGSDGEYNRPPIDLEVPNEAELRNNLDNLLGDIIDKVKEDEPMMNLLSLTSDILHALRMYAVHVESDIAEIKHIRGEGVAVLGRFRSYVRPPEPLSIADKHHLLQWVGDIETWLSKEDAKSFEFQSRLSLWYRTEFASNHLRIAEFLGIFLPIEKPSEESGAASFLEQFRSGVVLCELYNQIVRRSSRQFGFITKYHTDTAKFYRCADNLRYFAKAVGLRFDIDLTSWNVDTILGGTDEGDDILHQGISEFAEVAIADFQPDIGEGLAPT